MGNIIAAVQYALLRKTAAMPVQPAPVAPPPAIDPWTDRIANINAQAKHKQDMFKAKQNILKVNTEGAKVQTEAMKAKKLQKGVAASQAEMQKEEDQMRQEQAQLMAQQQQQQQLAQQQAAAPEPANPMQQATADQQVAMQKTAGAAPFYFGLPNIARLKLFERPTASTRRGTHS